MPCSHFSSRFDRSRRALIGALGLGAASVMLVGERAAFVGFGCSTPEGVNRSAALRQTVHAVMIPTFSELASATASLAELAEALRDSPSEAAIDRVRDAFTKARVLWKRSEAFFIGPSDDLAITAGAIDAWPAAASRLDELVGESGGALDAARVTTLPANVRGFPGIEQLLFDAVEGEDVADVRLLTEPNAERRRELLASQCADLANKCRALEAAWSGPEGYGEELAEAGHGSETFRRERDAVDKIVTGMLALAELILVAKIGKPLGEDTGGPTRPDLEEAPRSDFSLSAIEYNLLGLRAVYEAKLEDAPEAPASLGAEVRKASPDADAAFRNSLDAALSSVRDTKEPMRVLLTSDPAKLRALLEAVRAVKRSIQTDVASALGANLGFGFSDTD